MYLREAEIAFSKKEIIWCPWFPKYIRLGKLQSKGSKKAQMAQIKKNLECDAEEGETEVYWLLCKVRAKLSQTAGRAPLLKWNCT